MINIIKFRAACSFTHPVTGRPADVAESSAELAIRMSMCEGQPVGVEMVTKARTKLVPMANVVEIDFAHARREPHEKAPVSEKALVLDPDAFRGQIERNAAKPKASKGKGK